MKIPFSPSLLLSVSLSLLLSLSATAATAATKPNILILFADDQRADTIGAHGNAHIKTPVIDGLVRDGTSFRRNYVMGGNSGAVCVPSRAMLMTGKTWFAMNTATLAGEKLLPELFGENGYTTFGTGKWHNGQPSWLRAFQKGERIMFGGMSDHEKVPVRDLGPDGKLTEQRIGEKFSTELFADAAIRFLEQHDSAAGAKPFFCYVAFTAPHDPRQPPPGFPADYTSRPPLPQNFLPQLPFDNGAMTGGRDENLGAWPRTEAMIRDQLAEYYAMVEHMDAQIGRILAVLKTRGLAENTIIVYAADNGLALGSHGLLGKQNVFEHSMLTPLILAGPGVPKGKSTAAFTYLFSRSANSPACPRPPVFSAKASARFGTAPGRASATPSSCPTSKSNAPCATSAGNSSATPSSASASSSTCKPIPTKRGASTTTPRVRPTSRASPPR